MSTIGKICSNEIYDFIEKRLLTNAKPHLVVVQVGNDPASTIYIKHKRAACQKLNFDFSHKHFAIDTQTQTLVAELTKLNHDPAITAIIVQLPLPKHISQLDVLDAVATEKDVDCFNTTNVGVLTIGRPTFIPATPLGIVYFLKKHHIPTTGKRCVIIGKSSIVGRPLQSLLSDERTFGATTIMCDKYTHNLTELTRMADILIVAAGKHHLINSPDDVKQGAVVIDVGIHRIISANGKKSIQGDVNYNAVRDKCSFVTPVPGGVGPLTVACLMYNVAKPFLRCTNIFGQKN